MSYVRYTHFTIIIATYIASYSFPTNYMHVLIRYSTTDDAELHDDGTIVLDSEEEPLEEEDGSRELNRIPEKEPGNEHALSGAGLQ